MRIIPVLDVLGGVAVHARGGRRDDYRPVRSVLRAGSDPIALALALRDRLGASRLYVADLDAILGRPPALSLVRDLAGLGLETWIDAGLRDEAGVADLIEAGASRAVVGLETVAGPEGLRRAIERAGADRTVLSLDLMGGRPIVAPGADWGGDDPGQIVGEAVGLGVNTVILLDLARVGMGQGVGTLDRLGRCIRDFPEVNWIVGGGVSGPDDLREIAGAGASAVLVGSAIHDGRIGADAFVQTTG